MVTPESILKHEQNIEAIMISLKPTLSSSVISSKLFQKMNSKDFSIKPGRNKLL